MPDPSPDRFYCPWLGRAVELPGERELQIEQWHPDLLPRHRTALAEVLADPDLIRRGAGAPSVLLFSRGYADAGGHRSLVVVAVDGAPGPAHSRVVTAYITRGLAGGHVVWRRG